MLRKFLATVLLLALVCPMVLLFSPKAEAASYTAAQWKTLTDRFNTFLCGDKTNDMSNSSVKSIVTKIDNNCTTYWTKLKNMRSASVTKGLFDESVDNPNEMGWQYIYLWYMAQAYGTYGSQYYQNADLLADILYGINVMEKKFYTTSALKTAQTSASTFNWWDWAYNAPMHLCRILLAIRPSLTASSVSTYSYSSVKAFIYAQVSRMETMINTVKPVTGITDTFTLYENRRVRLLSWIMLAALRGVQATTSAELTTAATMMTDCHTALKDFFNNVSAGADGVNPDGSYICHTYFSMEGTYGLEVIVDRLIPAFNILSGTDFAPTSANSEILAQWMLETFWDVTRNGVLLSMNIGRYQDSGVSKGITLVKGALQLIGCFGPTEELQLRQMIKDMVPQSRYATYAGSLGDVSLVQTLYDVVYDDTVALRQEEYAVMRYTTDRAIQHTDSYTVGLAMSSTRISTHDCTNGRNRYGWYTGDGMLYVYSDRTGYGYDPYGTNFYKYANMYRMPGTTEENSTRRTPNSIRNHYLPRTDFVGGAELEGQYIAAAFDFDAYTWSSSDSATYDNFTPGTNGQVQKKQVLTSNLEAQKAYFMFDDEIVCVGNGINYSTNSNTINTYVNNMELRETATIDGTSIVGTEDIVVDGTMLEKASGYTKTYTNPKWIYQEQFGGYYFLSNASVTLNKTARTTVNDYNLDTSGKSTVTADGKTHSFLELWVNHGSKPSGGTYSYVMLPEKTQAEVQSYAASPDVSVLTNTTTVTVVKEKTLGITAYVFWKAGSYGEITVNQPMIVMVREQNGGYSLSVSDPSHKLSSATVTIKRGLTQVSNDSKITVKNAASTTTLTVNFSGSYGKSFAAKFTVNQTPYLFFDFQNTTEDKRRYNNTVYGAYNFDTAGWKINTNYVSAQSYSNDGIGTTSITMISGKNNPYLQTIGTTDSFNATPLSYTPTNAEVAVIRFKMQNCALTSGATTPQMRLYYIKNGVTTGVVNSDYISQTFDASVLTGGQYVTVTIPTNAAFRGATSINAIRPVFFNVTSASGKTGTITIDSIYVGPKQNAALYFDFRNDGTALHTYSNPIYSGNNYDSNYWGSNANRIDSLRYVNSGIGTVILTLQDGGTAPYIQTTDRTKSLTSIAMNYDPSSAEVAVVRFKMKGCAKMDANTAVSVRFTYGKNNDGADLASSQSFSGNFPAEYLNNDTYATVVVPVNADFKAADVIHALRVGFNNVTHIADAVGSITIDYIYVGPKSTLPAAIYDVTFKNADGTVLQTQSVQQGDAALYSGANPTRAADGTNHYAFKGWDKAFTNITADTTVTAQYTATAHAWSYAKADATNHKASCSCGYSKTEAHSYTYKATTNPTTSATGVLTGTCSKCSQTTTVTLPKLNTTDYTKTVTKAATCTATGTDSYKWNTTSYGSFSFTATSAALGHSYTAKVTAPTCTAQGYTTHTCSRCSDSYKDTTTNALGHSYSYKATKNPTLWATGTLTGTCTRCSVTTSVTLPKLNATDYTKTVTKAATCTVTGTDSYKWNTTTYGTFTFTADSEILGHSISNGSCTTCGSKYVGTLLHFKAGSPEINYAWNVLRHCDKPTFDTAGNGYMKGNISAPGGDVRTDIYIGMQAANNPNNLKHKLLTADEVFQVRFKLDVNIDIPAGSRTKFYLKTNDVTEAGGYSETYQVYTTVETKDAEGYSIATMTVPSTLVGKTIETLRVDFLDLIGFVAVEGTYAIDYIYLGPGCTAPNAVHSYSYTATKNPTTSATGTLTGTCANCKGTTTIALPKLNTTDYTKTVTKAATCTETGTDTYKWKTTTYGSFSFTATTAAKGHTEVKDAAVAATCTTAGKTEGSHCSVCNAVIKAQTTVAATGHNYTYKATKNPTTSATGTLTGTCSKCSGTTTVTLPKLNTTDYTKTVTKAATCTATGTDTYKWNTTTYGTFSFTATTAATGHSYTYKATKNPTTSATGTLTGTCSKCSGTTTVTLPKLNTTDYSKTVTKAATCTETGTDTYKWKTTTYGSFSFTATTAATGHSYTYKATKNPTTSATGTLTGTCSKCSGTTTVALPKLNTTDYTKTVTKAATCTATGTDTYKWNTTTYGTFSFTATTNALGHSYTAKVTAPTCTAQGYTTHTCSRCSDSYKDTYTNATGHSYTSKVTTAATCTKDGVKTFTCSKCSHSYTEAIAATGHTEVVDKAVAATCTTAGKTEGSHCSVCNAVIKAQTTVAATGHSYTYKATKNPTTSATGTLTGTCSKCSGTTTVTLPKLNTTDYTKTVTKAATCTETGTDTYKWKTTTYGTFSFTATTAAKGHTEVKDAAVTATCTTAGKTEGSHCSVCNAVIKAQTTVAATGHSYTYKATKNPTTSATGTLTGTCSKCSSTTTVTLPKLNTTDYTKTVTKAPTCTETGTDTYKWNTTTYGTFSFTATTAAKGHTEAKDAAVAATCTTAGKTEGSHCSVCNAVIKAQTTIPATGHSYTSKVTTAATCTKAGVKTFTCSKCNHSYTESIAATGHTEVIDKAVAATCTTAGKTEGSHCSVCNTVIKAQTTVPATGHSYTSKVTTAATCTKAGVKTFTCSKCSHSYTETIAATGHTEVVDKAVAATCTTAGKNEGSHCSVCNTVIKAQTTVAATGHSYSCKSNGNGTHTVTCARCNDSYTENHNFDNGACACGDAEITLDESIKILHTLDLASDISVTFAVAKTALANYDSYYLECVLPEYNGNTLVGTSTVEVQPVVSGNYYYFTLTGITAVRMGDMVDAVLHMTKGEQEYYSKTDSYSVATYAYGMLNSSKDAKMLTLCADLLRYGAEAQNFKGYRTDALVDADMTEVHRSYLSNTETLSFTATDSNLGDLASPTITWVGKTLDLGSKVGMKFVFNAKNYTGDLSKLSMKVTYQGSTGETKSVTVTGIETYNTNNKQYSFTFYGLLASELRTIVDVAIYNGNTQLSETLRYSAESYAAKTGTTALAALTKALFAYSDSAKAFFAK